MARIERAWNGQTLPKRSRRSSAGRGWPSLSDAHGVRNAISRCWKMELEEDIQKTALLMSRIFGTGDENHPMRATIVQIHANIGSTIWNDGMILNYLPASTPPQTNQLQVRWDLGLHEARGWYLGNVRSPVRSNGFRPNLSYDGVLPKDTHHAWGDLGVVPVCSSVIFIIWHDHTYLFVESWLNP